MSRNIAEIKDPGKLHRKARTLLSTGGVTRLGPKSFYVESTHPDPKIGLWGYIVRIEADGRISCHCRSFLKSGVCSHKIAVVMMLEEDQSRNLSPRPHASRT